MRILLLSAHPEDIKFFQEVASSASLSLVHMLSAKHVCDEINKDANALLVVDASSQEQYKKFEKSLSDEVGLFSESINPNYLFFVSSHEFHELPYLVHSTIFGHFIQRPLKEQWVKRMSALFRKIASNEMNFPIEYFFDSGVKVQTVHLTRSSQKKTTIDELKDFLMKAHFRSRSVSVITTAVDEIIMNAIFDAPIDETGKGLYVHAPRHKDFELDSKSTIEIKIAYDGNLLGISVSDLYGSLDKVKVLSHINKSYKFNEFKVSTVVAGAGLGLAYVYRNSGGLMIECEMGFGTKITLFYQRTDSFKEFKNQFRFLSTLMYFQTN